MSWIEFIDKAVEVEGNILNIEVLDYWAIFCLYANESPLNSINILVLNELTCIERNSSEYLNLIANSEASLCNVYRLLQ